jgi:hypothetical protein
MWEGPQCPDNVQQNSRGTKAPPTLFLRLRRRLARFFRKRLHPLEFLLESAREIVSAILEKHHKTKCEKDKEDEPEKAAKQRHASMVTYSLVAVNGRG